VWWNLFNKSKKLKSANKFSILWTNISKVRDEVLAWTSSSNAESSTLSNTNALCKANPFPNQNVFKKRNLIINELILQKTKDKLNKLQSYVEKEMNNFFIEKKENFLDCYEYFMINPSNTNEKFFELLETIYRKTLFNIIKGTLISFTEDSRSFLAQDINKIKDIARMKFDENKLVAGLNQLLKNLIKISQCFQNILTDKSITNKRYK
jgi:hypothetical protein